MAFTALIFTKLRTVPTKGKGEELVQITGPWRSGRGPGTRLCCICFCLSEL